MNLIGTELFKKIWVEGNGEISGLFKCPKDNMVQQS